MHYHTSENTPGYLPEADSVPTFETWNDAVASANADADEYVASIEDEAFDAGTSFGPVKVGVAGRGTGYVIVVRSDRIHDLGRAFAVDVCTEAHPEA